MRQKKKFFLRAYIQNSNKTTVDYNCWTVVFIYYCAVRFMYRSFPWLAI